VSDRDGAGSPPRSRVRVFVYALAILVGVLAVLSGLVLTRFDRRTDFRIFYRSALAWRSHQPIYPETRPNLNLPAVVVAYVPLTYLSERNALSLFTLAGIGCVIAASRRISSVVTAVPWFVVASLIFALEGGWTNLWLGQEGLVVMLLTTLGWLADRDRRDVAAGGWAGAAIYAKPFLAGLLIYWAWRRQWRSLGAAALAMTAVVLVGAAFAGPTSYLQWWRSLGLGPAPYSPLNASLLGLWSRLFFGSEFAPPLLREPPRVLLTLWALSIIVLVIAIYKRIATDRRADLAWALIMLGSLLVSPLGWIYYLPLAAGPIVASMGGIGSWICFWISAYMLLLFRSNVMANLQMSAGAALSVGSIYAWALLLLFVAAWVGKPETQNRYLERAAENVEPVLVPKF
jgi:MFS family permease